MMLTIVAFIVIAAFVIGAIFLIVELAVLPGRIAQLRGHPQAEAIKIAGMIGIVTGVLWPLALIWAYVFYPSSTGTGSASDSGVSVPADGAAVRETST